MPIELYAKYLGTYLDRKLTWRTHISERKKGDKNQADRNVQGYWTKKSALSLNNKLILYNEMELWVPTVALR